MTLQETKGIMAVLSVAFPAFYRNASEMDIKLATELWSTQFAEYDAKQVKAAVSALISSSTDGFPPTVGAVKEQVRKLFAEPQLTEQEAWALVSKATRNSAYGSEREFNKLPPPIQRAVGGPEQLRTWAMMDADTVESVVASNFMRTYKVVSQQEKEVQMLPQSVKEMLPGLTKPLLGGK